MEQLKQIFKLESFLRKVPFYFLSIKNYWVLKNIYILYTVLVVVGGIHG